MAQSIFHDSFRHIRHDSHKSPLPPIMCYITLASNQVYQVEVEHKADGQEVIEKLCKLLGIVEEADYFGVQFIGSKSEMIWINSRNRLSKQIHSSPPFHLYFKVKYFVPPASLQLEETRHQFYMNVVQNLKNGSWDSETSIELQSHLIALMAYVQFGNYNSNTTPCKYACFWPESRGEIPAEAISIAAKFHQELKNVTISHAKYELLNIVSKDVPSYGVYFYEAKDVFDRKVTLGVGPNAVILGNENGVILDRYPYCRIHTVTASTRVVTLSLLEDDASIKNQNYQLSTSRVANGLYRSITEMHAFFHSDTIKSTLMQQTTRDSIMFGVVFDHNGKEFTFDVKNTFSEVLDRTRRRMYHFSNNINPLVSHNHSSSSSSNLNRLRTLSNSSSITNGTATSMDTNSPNAESADRKSTSRAESIISTEDVQELVHERLREAAICRVCMSESISRVFFPCGHTICCEECADRVTMCPICRKQIDFRHPCYLPWDIDSNADGLNSNTQEPIINPSGTELTSSSHAINPNSSFDLSSQITLTDFPSTSNNNNNIIYNNIDSNNIANSERSIRPTENTKVTDVSIPTETDVQNKCTISGPSSSLSSKTDIVDIGKLSNSNLRLSNNKDTLAAASKASTPTTVSVIYPNSPTTSKTNIHLTNTLPTNPKSLSLTTTTTAATTTATTSITTIFNSTVINNKNSTTVSDRFDNTQMNCTVNNENLI